jgi:sugar phosphate isomerase/epimerase
MKHVFVSTGAFQTRSLAHALALCETCNIRHVELSSGMEYDAQNLAHIRAAHKNGMQFLVHNYFPPPAEPFVLNLASSDPQVLHTSREFCKQAIDLSAELGAPFYSAHSGFAFHLTPQMLGNPQAQAAVLNSQSRQQAYQVFLQSIDLLAGYARQYDMLFLIENNVASPHYIRADSENALLMCEAPEMLQCLRDANQPNLKLLIDVAHVNVSANALGFSRDEFLAQTAPHVAAIHISENDGIKDNNQPVSADAWFMDWLRQYREIPTVIEVYQLTPQQIQAQYQLVSTLNGDE